MFIVTTITDMAPAGDEKYASVDWPGWRGPTRDGVTTEKGWATTWPANGPRKLWDANVGKGYSSFAVVNGKAYTLGTDAAQKDQEVVTCLDAQTGTTIWTYKYAAAGTDKGPYPGPRSSPCVNEGIVYSIGRQEHILALDAEKGTLVWEKKDARAEFKPATTEYAFCGSPLILGKWVIFDIGPLVAFDRKTGDLAWKGKDYPCGHSSPVTFQSNGKTCVTTLAQSGLTVVDAANGSEIAFAPWCRHINACTPTPVDDGIFVESDAAVGSALVKLDLSYSSTRAVTVFPGMEANLKAQLATGPVSRPTSSQGAWKPFQVVEEMRSGSYTRTIT